MSWDLFGKQKEDGVWSTTVFCPKDYKNVNGWKQKLESINKKHGTKFFMKSIEVMGHFEMCRTHHSKIIGSRNIEGQLYYDDYYCKAKRGCSMYISDQKIFAIFIMETDIQEQEVKKEIPNTEWFSWIEDNLNV